MVLLSHEKKQLIINESYIAKIPLISFDSEISSNDSDISHSCQGIGADSTIGSRKTLFFIALNFLFKQGRKKSTKQNFNSMESKVKKRFT